MSGKTSNSNSWQEEQLDTLLTDFFAAEIPSDLKPFSGNGSQKISVPAKLTRQTFQNPPRRVSWLGLSSVAGVLCLAVTAIISSQGPSTQVTPDPQPNSPAPGPTKILDQENPAVAKRPSSPATMETGTVFYRNHSVHPLVVPVELRKFGPESLIHSNGSVETTGPAGFFNPDIEVFPFDDSSGNPKPGTKKPRLPEDK
jgi:hypothetical protein